MPVKLKNLIKEGWDSELESELKKSSDNEWKYKWSTSKFSGYLVNKKRTHIMVPYDIIKDDSMFFRDNTIDYLVRVKAGDKWLVQVIPHNQNYSENYWYKTTDDAFEGIKNLKLKYIN